MPLLFASVGDKVKVVSVGGAAEVKQHLNEIGFNAGTSVSVIQKIKGGIIVKVKESRIALDKKMAEKIQVG